MSGAAGRGKKHFLGKMPIEFPKLNGEEKKRQQVLPKGSRGSLVRGKGGELLRGTPLN